MEPVIRGKNLGISEETRSYIVKKLDRLSRHISNIGQVDVELTRESTRSQQERIVAQVTLNCSGTILRGEERAPTINAAIDAVVEVLDRRVDRLKGKLYRSEQSRESVRTSSMAPTAPEEGGEEDPLAAQGVVRMKRFPMNPMSVEEAIDQIEFLGHGFFFFFNSASGEYNVLYRRVNGGYGLLESEPM
ncbi:MAG: hypothetical protein HW388_499 [Dehalococcoidia bacterium]|nr:hypothetical protein [Dehalococcoidia bacterium]